MNDYIVGHACSSLDGSHPGAVGESSHCRCNILSPATLVVTRGSYPIASSSTVSQQAEVIGSELSARLRRCQQSITNIATSVSAAF
jgi:hypothetical protein